MAVAAVQVETAVARHAAIASKHAVTAAAVQAMTAATQNAAAVQLKTVVAQHSVIASKRKHAVNAVAQLAIIAVKVRLKELLEQ